MDHYERTVRVNAWERRGGEHDCTNGGDGVGTTNTMLTQQEAVEAGIMSVSWTLDDHHGIETRHMIRNELEGEPLDPEEVRRPENWRLNLSCLMGVCWEISA